MENLNIKITPLGAGSEVGRSCVLAEFESTKIIFDSGVHPAHSGMSCLPYFDLIELKDVKAVFITHFHLDHAGSLPYLTEKTEFSGRVFMTHPTKAILKFLLNDYIRIINSSSAEDLYSEKDLQNCNKKIEAIDYYQEINIDGLKISAYNAGHVLGAAMFLVKCGGINLLYTGDFSREEDRHLKAAEFPGKINVLITESTYGVQNHLSRAEREIRFKKCVSNIVKRGGNALLPVFALGRAQELLLILEEYWNENKFLQQHPIFYASALAKRCMNIYKSYINMMNDRIKEKAKLKNPFEFKFIECIYDERMFMESLKTGDPRKKKNCVMMASPGMLQSGLSRMIFDIWCSDKRNGVVISGYVINGTLAREIQSEPSYVESLSGDKIPLKMSIDYISFSAHVDYSQNYEFMNICDPEHIVLVHGEINEMNRLKTTLERNFKERNIEKYVYSPKNGEPVSLEIQKDNKVSLIGLETYKESSEEKHVFSGIFISKEDNKIVSPEKLQEVADLKIFDVKNNLTLQFNHNKSTIKSFLFSEFSILESDDEDVFFVEGIEIHLFDDYLKMIWENSYEKDVIAYSISEILTKHAEIFINMNESKIDKLLKVFNNYYITEVIDKISFKIIDNEKYVIISELKIKEYNCEELKEKVDTILRRVVSVI